jgi:hypothetical protein
MVRPCLVENNLQGAIMTETTFELADVKRLAAALDVVELGSRDRATLHAIFALAGQAIAGHNEIEVSGFQFDPVVIEIVGRPTTGAGESLFGSFQLGGMPTV